MTPEGILLVTNHSAGITQLLDPITKTEEVMTASGEWEAPVGWLHWAQWLPGHEAFFFFFPDAEEARLVDASGTTKARIGLAPKQSSEFADGILGVFEWDDLILFSADRYRLGHTYQIWDPTTGQTGLIEFEVTRIMLPLPTSP